MNHIYQIIIFQLNNFQKIAPILSAFTDKENMKNSIRCNPHIVWMALLIAAVTAVPLQAQLITKPVDLPYLAQRADVIVQGKVISVKNENLPRFRNFPIVEVTLEVENMLRGPSNQSNYTFKEAVLGLKTNRGKHDYQVGQRLVLFLPSPSSLGLSSPIGIGQGRFHIGRNAGSGETIANETGNSGLFNTVVLKTAKAGKKLTPEQLRVASTKHGPAQLNDFISLTKNLMTLPRIR